MEITLVAKTKGVNKFENNSTERLLGNIHEVEAREPKKGREVIKYSIKSKDFELFEHMHYTFEMNIMRDSIIHLLKIKGLQIIELEPTHNNKTSFWYSPNMSLYAKGKKITVDFCECESLYERLRYKVYKALRIIYDTYEDIIKNENVTFETAKLILPISKPQRVIITGNLNNWAEFIEQMERKKYNEELEKISNRVLEEIESDFKYIRILINTKYNNNNI